ncbi:hypothetical protein LP419_19060 [Massilia sp. H-1]|nr:hypothetical protein LP419_19060 [Massilia sp. H-1]
MIAGASLMSGAAMAQSKPYIGVGVATSDHEFKLGMVPPMSMRKAGSRLPRSSAVSTSPRPSAWKLSYTDLRKADHTFNYRIANTPSSATTDGHRAYIVGKATMPVNEQFSVYGKLGA